MLKKIGDVNFFVSSILIPAAALTLYCVFFAYFSSYFLLEGVNNLFANKLGKYALGLAVVGCLILFIIIKFKKDNPLNFEPSAERFYFGDLFLLLLPLTPIAQYVLNNQEILSPVESLYVLVFFACFSSIYIFAVPVLFGRFISIRTLMLMGLAFAFTITSMASISNYFHWLEKGTLKIQMLFLGGAFLISWLLHNLGQRKFLYLLITVNFIANSSIQLLSQNTGPKETSRPIEKNNLLLSVKEKTPVVTPNIYLLTYDAYVSNETMLAHGIDNSKQEDYLNKQGFTFYPRTYSIGSTTIDSMSKVLNASTDYYGNRRRGVSGDGVAQNILKDIGYTTYGLFYSDYMFRGIGESYNYSIPKNSIPSYIQLSKAILTGEFRFNLGDIEFTGQSRDQFINAKQSIFKDISAEGQDFVYMYTNLPGHSQRSGACQSKEVGLYKERVTDANFEMNQDIKTIIENDPGAIIVIAGDHGPYLTKNCRETSDVFDISEISRLDIQDRYGTFLAIKWPTGDFVKYDDITVLQDLFPAIFAYLYRDISILETKIEPVIPTPNSISGASVKNGIIYGGINDNEPLFLSGQ